MNSIGLIQGRRRQAFWTRFSAPSRAEAGKQALARRKGCLIADRQGAVAFETLIVYSFLLFSLFLPLADVAAAGFQFISAWGALRSYGAYIQYYANSDPTNSSNNPPNKTVSGYPIIFKRIVCGDANTSVKCSDATLIPNYYFFSTTFTLAPPMVLRSVLCPSSCTYTLNYSERFQ
jgi:hypothetical protein